MKKWLASAFIIFILIGCALKETDSLSRKNVPQAFMSNSADNVPVTSWFYPSSNNRNIGLVVYLHGGPHISVKNDMPAVIKFFTENGYPVLGVDYRGSRGYGAEFQNSIKGDLGRLEVEDIYSSLRFFLAENPAFKEKPIFLAGHSYGGFLPLLISTDSKNPFQKVVAMAAPADLQAILFSMERCSSLECRGASQEMRDDIYGKKKNVTYLANVNPLKMNSRIQVPVYVVQGELDPFVPIDLTKKFTSAAKKNGKDVRLLVLPGVSHDLGAMTNPKAFFESLFPVSKFLAEQ